MIQFFAHSITILSTVFALGGVSYLYIRFRTRVLRLVLLFLLSLLLLSIGFWFNTKEMHELGTMSTGMETFRWIFLLSGSGLNIIVIPHLVSNLVSIPLPRVVNTLLWVWNCLFIVLVLMFFLTPGVTFLSQLRTFYAPITIFGSILFCAVGIKSMKNRWWKKALVTFMVMSAVYLLLLILDILISILPIPVLNPVDGLSLTLYLIALNGGTFVFAGKFLSREAMVKNSELTESCVRFYKLTPREKVIVEELILGRTNKEIAEKLFISVKTVENHLYNIYQKIDVANRIQLLHTLKTWGSE